MFTDADVSFPTRIVLVLRRGDGMRLKNASRRQSSSFPFGQIQIWKIQFQYIQNEITPGDPRTLVNVNKTFFFYSQRSLQAFFAGSVFNIFLRLSTVHRTKRDRLPRLFIQTNLIGPETFFVRPNNTTNAARTFLVHESIFVIEFSKSDWTYTSKRNDVGNVYYVEQHIEFNKKIKKFQVERARWTYVEIFQVGTFNANYRRWLYSKNIKKIWRNVLR